MSEQWIDRKRLVELTALAEGHAPPLRVDAYLALNYDRELLGDWYTSRDPGPVDDHLRVECLKIHLDDGWGHAINWDPAELTATRPSGAGSGVRRGDAPGRRAVAHRGRQPCLHQLQRAPITW